MRSDVKNNFGQRQFIRENSHLSFDSDIFDDALGRMVAPKLFGIMKPFAPAGHDIGYWKFESIVGLNGLAKLTEHGKRLDLLALDAKNPGTGQFRNFINETKKLFQVIYVWEIWNENLTHTLFRYGFNPASTRDFKTGELTEGMVWKR